MKKITYIFLLLISFITDLSAQNNNALNRREQWLNYMDKVCRPVLSSLAADSLKLKMLVALSPTIDNAEERRQVAYLEALGRTISGISAWLQSEGGSSKEITLRDQYRRWALNAIANAVDSSSKDFMVWNKGGQPLVDASFLALGLIRCPWLWQHLDNDVKQQLVHVLISTRNIKPGNNNWILFTSMIEAFFYKYSLPYDKDRINYGLNTFMHQWYNGDGMFSDGPSFHMDYYNSYVIQPYMVNIIEVVKSSGSNEYESIHDSIDKINKRYAEIQERNINSDGSFPPVGRSITYRGGAFHHLADMALRKQLPPILTAAQVRCALFAVIQKTLPETSFSKDGWLKIGMVDKQPGLADRYITTGSLYLCTEIFLPLGLSADDAFWTDDDTAWTAKKIWSGEDGQADHAMELK